MNTTKPVGTADLGLGGFEYYGLQDYKRMLWRRRWTIVTTTLIAALITAIVAYFIPNVYKASTIILVEPRKVPDSLVASTATSAADRLSSLRQQVLSNTKLSQIIDEMGLYPEMKKHKTQEEIIAQMLKDTEVDVVASSNAERTLGAFRISYSSRSPQSAAQVANRLASLFIVQNMKERELQVSGTAQFMDRELTELKKDLDAKQAKVQAVKSKYISALPESESVHERAIATLELELRADMEALNRGQQQKVLLQSMLASTPPVVNLDGSSADSGNLQNQLASLEADRDQLLSHYGPDYPDVKAKTVEIQQLQQKIKDQQKAAADLGKDAASAPRSRNPVIESQLTALDSEMQRVAAHEKAVKEQLEFHQSKLQIAPELDQQLKQAQADADAAADQYKKVQERKFTADMSQDLEARQQAERFVVLEPALPPEKPFEPNRPLINGIGFGAGLLLGILVAIALEMFDTTVKTQREVTEQLPVPVFGEIPWLPTAAGTRRRHMHSLVAALSNSVLALIFLAIVYMTS
ncbi:MAG TPA: Wzz/FepE/Etk N-terminal domain-containing protein [Terriglobales bacterium]|nr:Wzz/FepE/Etk N-terminal domain-containing protein [Terriglobales bacterium]